MKKPKNQPTPPGMIYPKTWLTRPVRRLIMSVFITLFFVIAPLLIGYTAGFRYNFEDHTFERTGVISIDIEPRDAMITVNNIQILKRPPVRLPNRAPGTYQVRIEKSGFHSWEKDITVESQKTTFLRHLTLWHQALPALINTTKNDNLHFYPSPEGNYLILDEIKDQTKEVSLMDTRSGSKTSLMTVSTSTHPSAKWSTDERSVAIFAESATNTTIMILTLNNPNRKTWVLKESVDPAHSVWQTNTDIPGLYIEEQNVVVRFTPDTRQPIASITSSTIWHTDIDHRLWLFEPTTHRVTAHQNAEDFFSIPDEFTVEKIIDIGKKRVIVRTDRGILIVPKSGDTNQSLTLLPTSEIRYNSFTREWLTWSPWELWAIYANAPPALLNRTSEKMINVLPLDRHGVLLIVTERSFIAFNPGYSISHELWRGEEIKDVGVNQKERNIFFVGKVGSNIGLFEFPY